MAMTILTTSLIALASAAFLNGERSSPPPGQTLDEIVAVVNGEVITRRDVDEKVGQGTRQTLANPDPSAPKDLWARALLELVVSKVQLQAAKKQEIVIQKDFVEDELERIRYGKSEAELRDIVDQKGFTLEEFQEHLANEQLARLFWWSQFDDRVGRNAKQRPSRNTDVRPEEIRQHYAGHIEEFRVPERARVSLVMVSASRAGSREAARCVVDEIRNRVLAGEEFAVLAKERSTHPSAEQGGDLGWFERDAGFLPQITEFAFSQPPGSVSPVVEVGNVALLLRQDGHEPARVKEFEEVHLEIRKELQNLKIRKVYSEILTDLILEAYIWPPSLKDRLIDSKATPSRRK